MKNLSYLIDFVIVFLGILLALFFNKINERRNHKKRINSIMEIVRKDFTNDLKSLEEVIKSINTNLLYNKIINGDVLNDKEKEQSMTLSTNYPRFQISTRGFNLLKDAKVDFDFNDSDLITEIINLYDNYLDIINSYSLYLRDNTEKNFRSFTKYPWAVEFYKFEISEGYLKFLESTEYKSNLSYHYFFIKGPWKVALKRYQKEIKDILQKIEKSSFN
jgi:hypothetical protein